MQRQKQLQRAKNKGNSRSSSRMTSKNGNCNYNCNYNCNCHLGLFFEEWGDKGEDVLGDDLVALCCGVGAVTLHHAVYSVDSFE